MMVSQTEIQWIDAADFPELARRATQSERLRINRNFHAGQDDAVQRMLNVLTPGSYCPPHRHISPPKSETLLVLQGVAGVVLFDDAGNLVCARRIGGNGNPVGTDIPAGMWHTLVALSDPVVLFEVKPGPYDPAADKGLAPWAPEEGAAGAAAYLKTLEQAFA